MSFKHLKGNNSGFTLVELMVVVAIIGILSSVAIPSFKRYQAKAKTSEAKLHLASIYSAEVSFFSDADSYAQCLNNMGYNPSGSKNQRYYATGFGGDTDTAQAEGDDGARGINGITCAAAAENISWFAAGKKVGGEPAGQDQLGDSSVATSGATFIASAAGFISADMVRGAAAEERASIFRKSIEAYAEEAADEDDGGAADALAIRTAICGEGCAADTPHSVWGVNENKLIVEGAQGY